MDSVQNYLLAKYSPAETLIVLQGSDAPFDDLIKVTLLDLFLKKVLEIEKVYRQPSPEDPDQEFKYVIKGENFANYVPLQHEHIYLDSFLKGGRDEIFFRTLVEIGYDQVMSSGLYRDLIIKNPMMKEYFHQYVFQIPFGKFELDAKGKELQNILKSEFESAKADILAHYKTDYNLAMETIRKIGGNVFLIKELDLTLMKQLDVDLINAIAHRSRLLTDTVGKYKWMTPMP